MQPILVTTSPSVPGFRIVRIAGLVSGLTARTRGVGGKFIAGLQSIAGGEVTAFTSEMLKARDEALQRAMDQARYLGANAIISVDFETSEVFEAVVLVSVTGTAIVVEPEK
jgi:uncharacterized protein YbjQ (UPF0145 family)